MNRETPDIEEVRKDTKYRVHRAIEDLETLDLSEILEAQVISHLLEGRRTVAELVEEIYGQRKGDEGFMTLYSRVRRCVRQLESRGYVATRLFGRDKPYRLTKYAVSRLANFDQKSAKITLLPKLDLVLYLITGACAVVGLYMVRGGFPGVKGPELSVFYALFFLLVGASSTRLLSAISKVI